MSRVDQYIDIDRMMSEHELLLAYRDHISDETVQQLLSITELKLVQSGEEKKLRKRVFNILVECLQNVVNHSAAGSAQDSEAASILLLGRHNNDFFIVTGNRIANENIPHLEAKIAEINSWDHGNMRGIYSDRLGRSEYSDKGGAGLGLLDIYKRSGRKIKHKIDPIDPKVSFLSLHVTIDSDAS
ncbi:MAG: hypothetical protein RL266_151 [Bacteroidota bacterium]